MRGVPVLRYSELKDRCSVLGVDFTVTSLTEAVSYIKENVKRLKGQYICFGNVHTTVMAHEDVEYREIQNRAAFVMPDGMPIVKAQKKKGYKEACRVAGPDFMGKTFRAAMDGKLSMYFYGSTEETEKALEENLRKNYPGIDLRGFESPPFRELTLKEDEETVKRINESGADILWVGLGAPKQEKWMAEHAGRINALMLGVGAGFDFHGGTTKRAPFWIQKIGMEWLYRLFQDPKRLLKRYVVTNIKFLLYNH
ncbi:MAG: WecB/TagA/CpsF family glycosyltransferase [Lachnospiraceae bacterium]|nr:WecB/TagA/CpsF family glycosyltransferase [Lachnospiraceae bacterium]